MAGQALRYDFSRSGTYLPVPRGYVYVDLDDLRKTLFDAPDPGSVFIPAGPVLYFFAQVENVTVDITSAGVVTFNNGEPDEEYLAVGRDLVLNDIRYEIASISVAGIVTVTRPESNPQDITGGTHYRIESALNEATITTAGVLTFSGLGVPVGVLEVGHRVIIGNTAFIVNTVTGTNPTVSNAPATDTTGTYVIEAALNQAAIASNGVVTFTGDVTPDDDAIEVGNLIGIGSDEYPIESVNNTGVPTVTTTAAVAASAYSVIEIPDYVDPMGFAVTAQEDGDVDIVTMFGNEHDDEALTDGEFLDDGTGKEVVVQRIKQSSTIRTFKIGLY